MTQSFTGRVGTIFYCLLSLYHKPKDSLWSISTRQKIFFPCPIFLPFLPLGHSSSAVAPLHQGCGCHLCQIWRKLLWSHGLHGPVCERIERESSKHRIILLSCNRVGILKSVHCFLLPVINLNIPNGQEIVTQINLEQKIKHLRKNKIFKS